MTPTLPADAVASIANRLARLTIPLPMNVGEDPTLDKKEEYLKSQLQRDAGVFLERYGEQLTPAERKQFEGLRSDFEVDFYLRHLEDTDASRGATTRNRRLAYMNRLEEEGEYFSEEAMRSRAPGLYSAHVGEVSASDLERRFGLLKENDSLGRLERQVLLQEQKHAELQREQQERQRRQQQEEEEEEEDENEEDERPSGDREASAQPRGGDSRAADSHAAASEHAVNDEDFEMFRSEMQARFLAGEDVGFVDYATIDADTTLDDDWAAVANQDAQEQYFDAE